MTRETTSIVRAKDVMTPGIITIDGMALASEAISRMRKENVSSLLVNKRGEDDAWGIVVIQDFIRGVIIPGRSMSRVNVYEIMTKPVITVPAEMDVRYVARLLYRVGIRRAPVESCSDLVGMISLSALILDNDLF